MHIYIYNMQIYNMHIYIYICILYRCIYIICKDVIHKYHKYIYICTLKYQTYCNIFQHINSNKIFYAIGFNKHRMLRSEPSATMISKRFARSWGKSYRGKKGISMWGWRRNLGITWDNIYHRYIHIMWYNSIITYIIDNIHSRGILGSQPNNMGRSSQVNWSVVSNISWEHHRRGGRSCSSSTNM